MAEPGSDLVQSLLANGAAVTSRMTRIEVASALARRCREGSFPETEHYRALAALEGDQRCLYLVEVTAEVTAQAHRLLTRHPLRAADALQLASCLEFQDRLGVGVTFVAWDGRLLAAARREGLTTKGK